MTTVISNILFRNASDGTAVVWFMNGTKIASRANVVDEKGTLMNIGPPFSIVGTGSSPDVDAIAALFMRHQARAGGVTGPVGSAMGDVRKINNQFVRTFSGGLMELLDFTDGPQGFHKFRGEIRFVGFRCPHQSEGGDGDEPYFHSRCTRVE